MKLDKRALIELLEKNSEEDLSFLSGPGYHLHNLLSVLYRDRYKLKADLYPQLAARLHLPYLKPEEIKKHSSRAALLPYRLLNDNITLPIELKDGTLKLVTANPFNEKFFEMLKQLLEVSRVEVLVGSAEAIAAAINDWYKEIHRTRAQADLFYRRPEESAQRVLIAWQAFFLLGLLTAFILFTVSDHKLSATILFSFVNFIYFLVNPVKFYVSFKGFFGSQREVRVSEQEIRQLPDEKLPVYTILIPIFREAAVLKHLLLNIYRLDYPKDRLDVKLLMEEKDRETINEAKRLGLFGETQEILAPMTPEQYREFIRSFDPVIVPESRLKTKPRACNYGLLRARGELCVIYDAEDDPEKDQLKKAVAAFSRLKEEVVCLQCRLNFYNPSQNLLTRWFSLEYSFWFDYYLEGLDRVGAPLPLGGTSNHFRVKQLRELGGWDPYNVTEDADLGMRIADRSLKTGMLNSYTFEEANSRLGNWLRQRSRWYKGYVQTYLVHMRRPFHLLKQIGLKRFLYFQLTFGGNIFLPLANPFLWLVTLLSFLEPAWVNYLFYRPLIEICYFNLIVGNTVYILLHMGPYVLKKNYRLIPIAVSIPVYWMLISVGAWKGFLQLITRPFYWEKTQHGLSKIRAAQ